jgi:hypothetical protein
MTLLLSLNQWAEGVALCPGSLRARRRTCFGDPVGCNLVDTARAGWSPVGSAGVALSQLFDVVASAFIGAGDDPTAYSQIAVGIIRVLNGECHLRPCLHIAVFARALGGVDQQVLAIVINPDRGDVWGATGQQGSQVSEGRLFKLTYFPPMLLKVSLNASRA